MYYTHFGLTENPFKPTPDPRYLYLSRGHQEALDHLRYGIGERKGFIMVTGSVGTGKTTLLRSLLTDLPENVKTALILNPFLSDEDLLPTVCQEFGIETAPDAGKKACLDAMNRFLLDNYASGGNAVLLLDEAQNLSRDVLEQVRILSNLETENDKLLQIVLVGQEELSRLMGQEDLRQVNDRIVVRYHLGPLDAEDVRAYVQHRMTKAGSRGKVPFAPAAMSALYGLSGGVPRRINAICDRALLRAYTQDASKVGKDILYTAARETGVDPAGIPGPKKRGGFLRYLAAGLAGALAVLLVLLGWTYLRPPEPQPALALARPAPPAQGPAPAVAEPVPPAPEAPAPAPEPISAAQPAPMPVEEPAPAPAPGFRLPFEQAAVALLRASGGEASGLLFSTDLSPDQAAELAVAMQAKLAAGPEGGAGWVVIRSLGNQYARVQSDAGGEMQVSREELSRDWAGQVSWWLPRRFASMRLFPGTKGADVLWMQMAMARVGLRVRPDGVYGPETMAAVKSLQERFGISADGMVGFSTIGILYGLFPDRA